jgi:hypothetical protein
MSAIAASGYCSRTESCARSELGGIPAIACGNVGPFVMIDTLDLHWQTSRLSFHWGGSCHATHQGSSELQFEL